jgi:hypothetical protein
MPNAAYAAMGAICNRQITVARFPEARNCQQDQGIGDPSLNRFSQVLLANRAPIMHFEGV